MFMTTGLPRGQGWTVPEKIVETRHPDFKAIAIDCVFLCLDSSQALFSSLVLLGPKAKVPTMYLFSSLSLICSPQVLVPFGGQD